MTEERLEPAEPSNWAVQMVQILITLGYPEKPEELQKWMDQVKIVQDALARLWQDDSSGKVMVECLNVLYNVIALNSTPISPAVWHVLDLVKEEKITEIVDGILTDASTNQNAKVQSALVGIIKGLCQLGPHVPRLQDWALTIVQRLEARKNYTVLTAVAEHVIEYLVVCLCMPLYRPLIYPVFRQFLYPIVTPHVFYKIIDQVPRVLNALEKDINDENTLYAWDFTGLLRILLQRFPAKERSLERKYNDIKASLSKWPETTFETESLTLWDPEQDRGSSDWTIVSVNSEYEEPILQTPYKGLMNQGNTCFMNSVLQVLYMTTRFRSELLEKEIDSNERAARDLQQLFAFMQESNRTALIPNEVIESTLPATFRRGHQQDSSEYLIYLLDILHENENKILRRKRLSNSPQKQVDKKREANGDFEEGAVSLKHSEPENTIVERLFGGITTSTTVCSFCNRSFPKNDSFRDLHLSLPDDHRSCDLQELITMSLQPEELCDDNMYDCSSCGTKKNAIRRHTIVKAPQHLILTLKLFRFDPVRKQRLKLHSKLKSVRSIELPVHNSSQLQTNSVMYDLKGVVLHSGSSLDGGHYFSSAVDTSGQWYIFNDSVVSVAKCEWNNGGGTPYILMLRRSDICDPPTSPLPSNLQLLVKRDNQKYLTERRYQQRVVNRKRDYDDDRDDAPHSGSFGGSGPSLVY